MWQRRLLFYRMKVETNFIDALRGLELFRVDSARDGGGMTRRERG
jgi:hypothetical protein